MCASRVIVTIFNPRKKKTQQRKEHLIGRKKIYKTHNFITAIGTYYPTNVTNQRIQPTYLNNLSSFVHWNGF